MIAVTVTVAVGVIILGAWLRARAMEPSPLDDEPMEYEPHRDDRWGGDW